MQRKEKQRKFHEALVSILYPPPPSPHHQEEDDEEPLNTSRDGLNLDRIPDELEEEEKCSSPSSDNEGGFGLQKLTRAQRKRLRKKKLKEADSCRKKRKIIGPLLPTSSDGGDGECCAVVKNKPQAVRQNAEQELDTRIDKPGEAAACANENKLKQRRMTKKLAKERSKLSVVEKNHQANYQDIDTAEVAAAENCIASLSNGCCNSG